LEAISGFNLKIFSFIEFKMKKINKFVPVKLMLNLFTNLNMRYIQKTAIVLLLTIAGLFFFSCTSEDDDKLIGTWKFINVEEQIQDPKTPAMTATDVENMKNVASYVFNRNRTYILNLGTISDQGKWYISENGAALNMESETSNAKGRATIRELTSEKLVLVIQLQGKIQILSLQKQSK
jgi:hypothetical protein